MAVAEELVALLGYRVQGQAELGRWKKGLDDSEKSARRSADGIRRMGVAAGAVTTAGIALATKGLKDYAAFERGVGRIGITAGASVEATNRAGAALQDMASRFALPLEQAKVGLDTLVSSGMSLEEAMKFLPSVLMTAQAAGAATDDIANTAQKTASAFGLQASEMQKAFDIMVTGGKAGQFELKDMAQQIPTLASQFSTLGYKGESGLKALIAALQTLRTRTGTAGEAATQASNIFAKMFSEQTEKNFKDFGINLRKEMDAAKKSGTDALTAFVDLSEKALKGDMTKLPKLFQDLQLQQGMTTLMQARKEWKGFIDDVNGSAVDGSTLKDFQRVSGDTASSIQRMSNSWDNFVKAVGATVAPPATSVMDNVTKGLTTAQKADEIRKTRGESTLWRLLNHGANAEEIVAGERQKASMSHLYAQPPAVQPTPDILKSRRSAGMGKDAKRTAGLNYLGRSIYTAGPEPSLSDEVSGALSGFKSIDGKTATATAVLDVAQFMNPLNLAKQGLDALGIDVTAKADLDISPLLSKVEQAKTAIQSLRSMSVGGASPASTPARVAGAGTAP